MMKKTLATAALCGSLLGMAASLPAQAQSYGTDSPTVGTPYARSYVVVEQPSVEMPAPSATSRDNEGRPTHGALGTGDADRELAMSNRDSYTPSRRDRFERY